MWVVDDGNISELGDAGMGPRKSFLFFLTGCLHSPWNFGLPRAKESGLVEYFVFEVSGAPITALENPREPMILTPGRTHNRIRSPR